MRHPPIYRYAEQVANLTRSFHISGLSSANQYHVREPPQRTRSTRRGSDSTGVAQRRAASCRIAGRTTRAIRGVVRPPIGHDAGSRPARQAGPSNPSLSGLGGLGGQTSVVKQRVRATSPALTVRLKPDTTYGLDGQTLVVSGIDRLVAGC